MSESLDRDQHNAIQFLDIMGEKPPFSDPVLTLGMLGSSYKAEVDRLRTAVAEYLDAEKQELCHVNRNKLAHAIGRYSANYPQLSPEKEFAVGCILYRKELYGPDGPSEEHPEGSELDLLIEENSKLKAEIQNLRLEIEYWKQNIPSQM